MRALLLATAIIALSIASSPTWGQYTFEDWARDNGYMPGDVMPEFVDASSSLPQIEQLDGVEAYDWNATPTRELRLSDNRIPSIESGVFDGLTNLRTLYLWGNGITNIESGVFDELNDLQWLRLHANKITSIESGVFDGLTNLRELSLWGNDITTIEPSAFTALPNLSTLLLDGNELGELNLAGASFEHLHYPLLGIFGNTGFWIDSEAILSLVLDGADLSKGSFDAIVGQTTAIMDASLVGLSFTDGRPDDLSPLFGITTLDKVRVGPTLFGLYADEFNAFDAIDGNTVTVIPEPSTVSCALLSAFAAYAYRIRRRLV